MQNTNIYYSIKSPYLNNRNHLYTYSKIFDIYVKVNPTPSTPTNPDCIFIDLYTNIQITQLN